MATLVAAFKFTQFIFWCALLIPPQAAVLLFTRGRAAYALPRLWHKMICRAFRIQVEVAGAPVTDRQALYVSNHVSYLDIPAISCVLPVSFVAKADVEGWPLFGLLAKLQQTVFISRSRQRLHEEKAAFEKILKSGRSLVIFPEGTSSDGAQVLAFKSSLFSVVPDGGLSDSMVVQPFTVELVGTDERKIITQKDRDNYAWYGDMTLMPHFWHFAKLRGAKVKLHFHAPVKVKEGENRKELARRCQELVAAPLASGMAAAA